MQANSQDISYSPLSGHDNNYSGNIALTAQSQEQQTGSDSIIVRNVSLLSQADTAGLRVSLLIIDGRLEVVTMDDIKDAPGATVYDGQAGFLMGRVEIGQPPSFVVLRENPREQFDIFLNTGDYIIFAMEDGKIVSNKLNPVKPTPEQE
ncbi:MAG: hypothetical protein L0Y37_05710, partial [Bacteroidales bacterium]|nr:hypothetical protein [Bacteroidales bacterium]